MSLVVQVNRSCLRIENVQEYRCCAGGVGIHIFRTRRQQEGNVRRLYNNFHSAFNLIEKWFRSECFATTLNHTLP